MDTVLKELCFRYEKKNVLDRLSHRFEQGGINCIMGASGCGKTTLLRLLAGLLEPSGGTIEGLDGLRRAMVFQEDRLADYLSVENNIRIVARRGFTSEDVAVLLRTLDLEGVQRMNPTRLSGGMRRRIALARALAADFDLLLLDEPFTGLDERTRDLAMHVICERSKGRTVILTTHDPAVAETMGTSLLKL